MNQSNEQTAAIAAAEQSARARPEDFTAWQELGAAYFEQERYGDAEAAYRRALALNPASADALESIGHIHYRRNETAQAEAAYEQAILLDPHYVYSYFGLGILHATKTGDHQRAVEAYRRGLAANPGSLLLTTHLAGTLARAGQVEQAVAMLEQVAQAHPEEGEAWGWLNLLYLHQGRLDDALAACRAHNAIRPDHSSHRLIGLISQQRGQLEQAEQAFQQALALEPGDYEARAGLARVYRETGRSQQAEAVFQAAWQAAWDDHQEYGQACVQVVSGRDDQALDLLETALAKHLIDLGWVRIDPEFAFLHSNPRFQQLLNQA